MQHGNCTGRHVSPSMDGRSHFIHLRDLEQPHREQQSVSKSRSRKEKARPPLTLRPSPNIRELPHCTLLTLCLQPSLRTRHVSRGLLDRWKHRALVARLARMRTCWARRLMRVALHRWAGRVPAEQSPSLAKSLRGPSLRRALCLLSAHARVRLRLDRLEHAEAGVRREGVRSRLWHMRLRAYVRLWRSAARAVATLLELERRAERCCAMAALCRWRQAGATRREAKAAARRAERVVLLRRWRRHAGLLLASPRHALLRSQRRPAHPASPPPPPPPPPPPLALPLSPPLPATEVAAEVAKVAEMAAAEEAEAEAEAEAARIVPSAIRLPGRSPLARDQRSPPL